MLSRQDNELLTRIGPGTPMGELLRRFWMPALLEEEVAEPDGPPVRLRLMGEDLVAFRDTNGRIGVLDAYCPHRTAHLYFGRNEECGLRCVYHGWKFDVDGNCVDQPSEPPETNFAHKVRITSYPAAVRGNIVWVYMGPRDRMPALPDLEFAYLPANQRTATKRVQRCNWAQAVEGGIDSSHVSFLHSNIDSMGAGNFNRPLSNYFTADRHPVFDVRETDYGLMIGARRDTGEGSYYWRITQFLMPFFQMIPPAMEGTDSSTCPYAGHAWVPIDEEHTWTWSFGAQPHMPLTPEEQAYAGGRDGMWGPIDESYMPLLNKDNDYLIDRAAQKTKSFTGIAGIPNQDAAVQESMGPIADRTREHLGTSDRAVIAWRKKMLAAVRDLQSGREPTEPQRPEAYNVRSVSVVLRHDVDWQAGADWLIQGLPREARLEVAE